MRLCVDRPWQINFATAEESFHRSTKVDKSSHTWLKLHRCRCRVSAKTRVFTVTHNTMFLCLLAFLNFSAFLKSSKTKYSFRKAHYEPTQEGLKALFRCLFSHGGREGRTERLVSCCIGSSVSCSFQLRRQFQKSNVNFSETNGFYVNVSIEHVRADVSFVSRSSFKSYQIRRSS